MAATKIEWCDHSINPIRADRERGSGHYCEKISSGCANCYASKLQKRFRMPAFPGPTRDSETVRLDGVTKTGVRAWLDESKLAEIRKRRKPTRYFVCDMTDPFGWWVKDEWLDAMFATFALCPRHTFLLLTKRPERMRDYLIRGARERVAALCPGGVGYGLLYGRAMTHDGGRIADLWPLWNVWLGVSAENQKTWDDRVRILAEIPAAMRFVSVEPMLEAIDFASGFEPCGRCVWGSPDPETNVVECRHCEGSGVSDEMLVDWIIFGGESGQGARLCNVEWIRDGLAQCKAAGVKAFCKQIGANPIGATSADRKGGIMQDWPLDIQVRDFPNGA